METLLQLRTRLRAKGVNLGRLTIPPNDDGGFPQRGHFFQAVKGHPGSIPARETLNPKLANWTTKCVEATAGSDEQAIFSDPHGGFLVPPALLPGILSRVPDADPLVERTMPITMPEPEILIPYRVDNDHSDSVSGGFRVYRREEAAEIMASRGEVGLFCMSAKSLYGAAFVTRQCPLEVSASLVEAGFTIEFGARRFHDRIHGTGVGEPLGILNSGALITVAKETGQAAKSLLPVNVYKMAGRCWHYDLSAVWLVNPELREAIYTLNQTAGVAIWTPPRAEGEPGLLLGRPLYFHESMPALGDVGDILCVDPSQYLDAEYQPIEGLVSVFVRFVEHEQAFKFWTRGDGAPWWNAPLTPKNGTATLSPFVALAERA